MEVSRKNRKKIQRRFRRKIEELHERINKDESLLICLGCNGYGRGTKHSVLMKDNPLSVATICKKCGGEGIVDWVDVLLNRSKEVYFYKVYGFWIEDAKERNEYVVNYTIGSQAQALRKKKIIEGK